MMDTTRSDSVTSLQTGVQDQRFPRPRSVLGWLLPPAVILTLLVIWEAGVRINDTPAWFLPSPTAIGREMIDSWGLLWGHTWTTVQEVLIGYVLAFLIGVGSALLIASSWLAERTVYPVIVASQAIPIIALAPILLIWFGYGLTPKVIVVILICFFPIAVNMADGLRSADLDAIALLRSMGAGRWQVMRLVRIPSSLPYLVSGARVAAAVSVIGAVVGEWVGASSGLGYLMTRSASQFLTARLFAAVGISAMIGITLFVIVAIAGRLLVPWQAADPRARE